MVVNHLSFLSVCKTRPLTDFLPFRIPTHKHLLGHGLPTDNDSLSIIKSSSGMEIDLRLNITYYQPPAKPAPSTVL